MKSAFKIIIAVMGAAVMASVSCQKVNPVQKPNEDPTVNEGQSAKEERVITVSFTSQTKTTLDGLQPKFLDDDKILVSNGQDTPDTCLVSVSGGVAIIKTRLAGPLTAVYPAKAAKMKDDNGNEITGIHVSTVQDGTFASANICMTENIITKAEFKNKTALFCIKPPTANTSYVDVISTGPEIADSIPTGETTYISKTRIHVSASSSDSVWVSILVPSGLTIGDLSFSDGTKTKTVTGDNANTEIAGNTLYTISTNDWTDMPYVEIAAKYDGTNVTFLKWHRQNLAITLSGSKPWKGDKTSGAVKVPGTDKDVIVGDYFQWAAYAGYCGDATAADKGLLIYNSFNNTKCVDVTGSDSFEFKSAGGSNKYQFKTSNSNGYVGISPYYSSSYQYYETSSHSTLCRETSYTSHNDDVASIILGGDWRMPTLAEFQALYNATYWAWDGTDLGYYVFTPDDSHTGGTTVNSILTDLSKENALLFFPAAGGGSSTSLFNAGSAGRYWSSSLNTYPDRAYFLEFENGNVHPQSSGHRYYGLLVRPVSD